MSPIVFAKAFLNVVIVQEQIKGFSSPLPCNRHHLCNQTCTNAWYMGYEQYLRLGRKIGKIGL